MRTVSSLSFLLFTVASGALAALFFRLFAAIMLVMSPYSVDNGEAMRNATDCLLFGTVLAASGIVAYVAVACALRGGFEWAEETYQKIAENAGKEWRKKKC